MRSQYPDDAVPVLTPDEHPRHRESWQPDDVPDDITQGSADHRPGLLHESYAGVATEPIRKGSRKSRQRRLLRAPHTLGAATPEPVTPPA